MEFVKRYIFPSDYHNVILVNKEWNKIISTMKEHVLLHYLLKENGWFSKYTHNIIKRKELNYTEILDCLLEAFKEKTDKVLLPRYKEPFNYVLISRIKKRFPWLNLCGY